MDKLTTAILQYIRAGVYDNGFMVREAVKSLAREFHKPIKDVHNLFLRLLVEPTA